MPVKKKEYENLSDSNLEKVSNLLNSDNPISKKEACKTLNIAYNTARLKRILEEYQDKKEYAKKRKRELKGKPLSDSELKVIISSYLEGDSITDISNRTFRSLSLIKKVLIDKGVPKKSGSSNCYWEPELLPEESIRITFKKDELVWSARYNEPATIMSEYKKDVYCIWLENSKQYAYQAIHELGSLDHLNKYL